jgi:hypothetical protein
MATGIFLAMGSLLMSEILAREGPDMLIAAGIAG